MGEVFARKGYKSEFADMIFHFLYQHGILFLITNKISLVPSMIDPTPHVSVIHCMLVTVTALETVFSSLKFKYSLYCCYGYLVAHGYPRLTGYLWLPCCYGYLVAIVIDEAV